MNTVNTKRGFIQGPPDRFGQRKIVNLDQVSNIFFEEGKDRFGKEKYKIIFNFAYPISLKSNIIKKIPDYVYFVYDNKDGYDQAVQKLNKQINEMKWYAPIVNGRIDRIVNPKFISFISTDSDKNRIITNLSCSVSFYNDFERTTSDFIYFTFETPWQFNTELVYLMDILDVRV